MGNRSTNTNTGDNIRVDGHLVSFFNSNFKTRLVGTNIGGTTPVVATGGTKTTPGNGYIYHVFATCLLYTSPSPRDVEESRMPSSA